MKRRLALLLLWGTIPAIHLLAQPSAWVRPTKPGDALVWGRKDGIVFGLPSANGMPGPRGLIRVGTIDSSSGQPDLLNFIAVEPATEGKKLRGDRMGFSELEKSRMDPGMRGARLWAAGTNGNSQDLAGILRTKVENGQTFEVLTVRIEIERFTQNGAHVYLELSIQSNHPNELHLSAYPYMDSKPLDEVVFTATMGAYERLRLLWLKDHVIDSRELYATYKGYDFAEKDAYPLEDMLRDSAGDPIVFCTSSEQNPSKSRNPNAKSNWYYSGPRITQYWRIPSKEVAPNLRVRVNGRHTYWQSKDEIPGGTSFENFEVREKFRPGQTFIFGISRNEPSQWTPPLTNLGVPPELN